MDTFVFGQIETFPTPASQSGSPLVLPIVLLIFAILVVAYTFWDRSQAKQSYDTAYANFKANPSDTKLRDKALGKADTYAKAMGGYKSDQQMHATSLKQSIEAMHQAARQNTPPTERLKELQSLLDGKLISDEEFRALRQEILQSV